MIAYLIKSSLCLLLLGSFYKVFLEKEKVHNLKRYFLICSIVFAYSIPLITFTYEKVVYINPEEIVAAVEELQPPVYMTNVHKVEESPKSDLTTLLWSIYILGVLVFGFRFIRNLYSLGKKVRGNERRKEPLYTNVLLNDNIIPHTFLKYIFVPKSDFLQKSIPEEVLFHERAHVQQKHTLDILFVEILQVIFWFNPLLIWIKKAIRLNHEFLADQTVLKHKFSIQRYVNLLVNYPNSTHHTELTSTINYSLTKKRLQMMTKEFSKKRVTLKLLAVIPVLALCLLFFNNKIVAQEKNNWRYSKTTSTQDKEIEIRVKNDQIKINGSSVTLDNLSTEIDNITKDWNDDDLKGFNFDVKLQNVDQRLVEKINTAYRTTRLYKSNPDKHDLIPPPPPAPMVRKGQTGNVPPPPSISKKAAKSNAPKPPRAPKAPAPPTYSDTEEEEEFEEEELALEENEEKEVDEVREQRREIAMLQAERARERAEYARQRVRREAERVKEQTHRVREEAMVQVEKAREAAEKARAIAMEEAHKVRAQAHQAQEEAMKHARLAREEAEKVREMAMKEAQMARKEMMKERDMALKEARKAQEMARKAAQNALKEARKEQEKNRKEERKARRKAAKDND
ncbi:hypothetical protein M0D21_05620 [Aquimarina sp. D1M17]|uniref:M56 family metallopeptidase n=1 Tax=Aquimarina acroporae TaxID=2937283 RepID=UPI0020BE6118|nr:M56 family metallopeptidase [Aquimarina acroporae]MCK8521033.1 hypothetical protein [Aquimarina acroporae]